MNKGWDFKEVLSEIEQSENEKEMKKSAKQLYMQKKAFMEAGFTSKEAFDILFLIMQNSI